MRRVFRIVGVTAVAALALTGCGNGKVKTLDYSGSKINAQDRSKLKQGGDLVFSIADLPPQWNYLHTDGTTNDVARVLAWITPITFNYSGNGEATENANYVEKAELKEAKDGKPQQVILTLNPKAVWNNGKSITWEDYAAPWKACNGENKDFKCSSNDGWNEVAKVEKGKDEFQVIYTFKTTYPDWKSVVSAWNKDSMANPKAFNDAQAGLDKLNNEWLSGPYKLGKIDVGAKTIELVPNEKWWGEKPLLDHVFFRVMDPKAEAQAYLSGKLTAVTGIVDAATYKQVSASKNGDVRSAGGTQWRHFTINSKSGVFADKKVRQALAMGIDRVQLTKALTKGLPVEPDKMVLGNHILLPAQKGYKDNAPKYDLAGAKKLLDEAGWKPGADGIREKDGQKLEAKFLGLNFFASSNEGRTLQTQAKAMGMNIIFDEVSPSKFFKEYINPKNYAITSFAWVGSSSTPYGGLQQIYGCDGGGNYTNVCNKEIDTMISKVAVEMDPQKRIDMANELDKKIWDEVYSIPLYARNDIVVCDKKLANYGAFGLATLVPENVGFMK